MRETSFQQVLLSSSGPKENIFISNFDIALGVSENVIHSSQPEHLQGSNIRPNNEAQEQDDQPYEDHQVKRRTIRRSVQEDLPHRGWVTQILWATKNS